MLVQLRSFRSSHARSLSQRLRADEGFCGRVSTWSTAPRVVNVPLPAMRAGSAVVNVRTSTAPTRERRGNEEITRVADGRGDRRLRRAGVDGLCEKHRELGAGDQHNGGEA